MVRRAVGLAAVCVAVACARPPVLPTFAAVPLAAPTRPGSGQPNLAVSPDGRVLLTWIEPTDDGGHALRFATRGHGTPWSEPRTVASGSRWFVNWADFPSVAFLPDGTPFAHWLEKSGSERYAYDVRVAASRDGGARWGAPVVPHRDGTPTEHGFASLTAWDQGAMGMVWLDGRATAGSGHDGHKSAAAMALRHTTVTPEGGLGAETVLDERVCDCCQTDAVRVGTATVVVYRDRSDREVRDIAVVRFADGRWSAPQPVARDGWEIDGCPVNGPAIAAEGETVAVAWFTAPQQTSRVKVAFSKDAGRTFGPPTVVDDGRPLGRVDVVMTRGVAVVSWLEQVAGGAALRVRAIAPGGARGAALTLSDASSERSGGFPRMALGGDEIVVAWRDTADPPVVRTAIVTRSAR